ncbi:hypothetical protein BABINDRAFT_162666 [Babjeviella inositovora NRRL Y-12698]|uniref:MHD domain-containing protein n=1 Tax=Babjeviella inositovora NRRL Y-12698 TaxID=984486 RepID=A0A1E3QL79_9ASCO|nr:uncharacterized protein BABINDRAFT_162666 [Babjeviella inositovora NRRL Y-12698]ODQ78443.1 hypothetical protein BABINDRAFT_162666 [Babjeviella inositovora NRRL Y-12698]
MASSIHFLDVKGKPLLSRDYKGDIPSTMLDRFPLLLLENEEANMMQPFIHHQGVNFVYISHKNLYLLAMTKKNDNVMQIVIFLQKVIEVLTEYVKQLEEESIRDNFVVIYELLDEMMDFGCPQVTDSKILKEYITLDYYSLEKHKMLAPPAAVTNSVSWRQEGIFYKKNEAFLDVIESINMLVNSTGQVLHSEILGRVKIKSNLSGMPDLRLGLNDKGIFNEAGSSNAKGIELEDIKFHQCVRLSKFETDRIITFIPPDGEFDLMSYRLTMPLKPLIHVECKFKIHSNSRIEILARVRAQIKRKSTANNVEIMIPIPEDADTPKFKSDGGKIKWKPEESVLVWKFKSFQGGKEYVMKTELGLPSVNDEDVSAGEIFKKKPIKVNFLIPYFTTSGIQVKYLRINEPKLQYQSYPWVRYITENGPDYTIRMK